MDSYERVLGLLERVTGNGSSVRASCPVPSHGQGRGDRNPSLSVTHTDGKTLLNCMNGCHPQDVLMALGLEWPDLFDEPIRNERGVKVAEWKYQHRDGSVYFTVERWQKPDGGKSFVQRVPGEEKAGYPAGFRPCLYNLPAVLDAASHGDEVWIVEGEKSVSAARHLGLVATCSPNGAKAWRDYYTHWLKGASVINIVADNDKDGRERYAASVSASCRAAGLKTRVWSTPLPQAKADLYDHVLAGLKVEDLITINVNRLRPTGATLTGLLGKDYPPVKWAVDGLISSGLTLFGGSPKLGKSYVALDLGLGVACGGLALSTLHCQQGDVLMLALDNDTERRVKERSLYLFGNVMPDYAVPMEVHTEWPVGVEALAACQEWVADSDNPRMIVIDTLVKVEPYFDGNGVQNSYAVSSEVLSRWARFATESNIAVVAIHHDRKRGNGQAEDVDWLDRFTGSRGITAAAQTLMMLDAKRGEDKGMLRVAGRDIETSDLEMTRVGRSWAVLSMVPQPA
jgi:hypothetical protein